MPDDFSTLIKQVNEMNLQLREYRAAFRIIQVALSAFGAVILTSGFVVGCRAVENETQTRVDTIKIADLDKRLLDIDQRISISLNMANDRWDKNNTAINQLKDTLRNHWNSYQQNQQK